MITALFLLGCGFALACRGIRLVVPDAGLTHAPLSTVVTWLIAELSVVTCWVLGGLLLAWPEHIVPHWLTELFAACVPALRETVSSPHWTIRAAGIALTCTTILRPTWYLTTRFVDARRRRARHAEAIRLVGRPHHDLSCVIVDHGPALAYCVPGHPPLIVLTRSALHALSPAELAAVLAHEHTHLAEHHHIPTDLTTGLARAFQLPLFTAGARTVPTLLEMRADDTAVRQHGKHAVAGALLSLTNSRTPQHTRAAIGGPVTTRLHRMLTAPGPWQTTLRTRYQPLLCSLTAGLGPYLATALLLTLAAATHTIVCPHL